MVAERPAKNARHLSQMDGVLFNSSRALECVNRPWFMSSSSSPVGRLSSVAELPATRSNVARLKERELVRKGGHCRLKLNERFPRASDASSHRSKVLSTYVQRASVVYANIGFFLTRSPLVSALTLVDVPELSLWTGFQLLPADLKYGRWRKKCQTSIQEAEFGLSVRLLRTPPLNHLFRHHTRLPGCSTPSCPRLRRILLIRTPLVASRGLQWSINVA